MFRALQQAFYVDGLDTTDGRVLSALVAEQLQLDIATVLGMWQHADTIAQTRADFSRARALGVRSFPALLLDKGGDIVEVSGGYAKVEQLHHQLLKAKAV